MFECSKSSLSWWLWMGGSVVFAVAAIIIALTWNSIFNALISSVIVLSPNSMTYKRWVAPDQPLYFEVFMFNWTNADRFPAEKPRLQQLGPYRFREVRKHVNVTFHPHNSSVAYRTQRTWYFDSSTSNGSLQDPITSIDMIAASAVFRLRHAKWSNKYLLRPALNLAFALYNTKLWVNKTVGEMLFEGYEDHLLTASSWLPMPEGTPRMDRFGWFYSRNNSINTDGYVEVSSGVDGTMVGQIRKWNHHASLPYFEGNCSRMEGSAGEFAPRNLTETSTLTMFVPDLCRTINLEHVKSGVLQGLNYHKYEMLSRVFDKCAAEFEKISTSNKNNCFCNGECKWSGVMNVSACQFGAPAFLSLPHFLYGDAALHGAVEGLAPDPEKHSFYFSVEPTLGVPLDVAGRFQFNVYLEPVSDVPLFANVPNMLFPVFWVQQHVIVMDSIFTELRAVVGAFRWGGLVFALISLVCIAIIIFCNSRKPKYIIINTR